MGFACKSGVTNTSTVVSVALACLSIAILADLASHEDRGLAS